MTCTRGTANHRKILAATPGIFPIPQSHAADQALLDAATRFFAGFPQVAAVALGGSRATGAADEASDFDLYVYAGEEIPVASRAAFVCARSSRAEIDNRFFEPGDEWNEAATGTHVDVTYRTPAWAENELSRVLDRHEASLGYSTSVWHNLLTSTPLFDRNGWLGGVMQRARRPYPEGLARAVVARNRPLLRDAFGSFGGQVVKAAGRGDPVSVNHRVAAFLASYFDILFALNRTPHPGEKRLLALAGALPRVPPGMEPDVRRLLAPGTGAALASALDALCEGLDGLLRAEFEGLANRSA